MEPQQRFALFLTTLEQEPFASNQVSARELLTKILNAVEDAHSGAPYDPANWKTDGRMYPPQDDNKKIATISGASVFHTKGHRVWFGDNGSIRLEVRRGPGTGRIELDKPGADGKLCPAR